jgi:hypothetical protein
MKLIVFVCDPSIIEFGILSVAFSSFDQLIQNSLYFKCHPPGDPASSTACPGPEAGSQIRAIGKKK